MSIASLRQSPLRKIPLEVLCIILSSLDVPTLLRCSQVNNYFRNVIRDTSSLQYKILLEFANCIDTLPSTSTRPSLAKRLALLREREDNWKALKWKSRMPVPLSLNGSVYEFIGGVYGCGKDEDKLLNGSVSFFQLPARSWQRPDIMPTQQWTHSMPKSNRIIDFSVDPTQDLLILVGNAEAQSEFTYEIYLLSLTTGEMHPSAPHPIMGCIPTEEVATWPEESGPIRIQISGNHLGFLVKDFMIDGGARLQIWDWKAASCQPCVISRPSQIDDFVILSETQLLMASPDGHLEVCVFADIDTPGLLEEAVVSYIFQLPHPKQNYSYWYISLALNPSHGYVPSSRLSTHTQCTSYQRHTQEDPDWTRQFQCHHCPPYEPNPQERILSCCLYVWNPEFDELPGGRVFSFLFFAPIKTFMRPFPLFIDDLPIEIAWRDWGISSTRWFAGDVTTDWNHGVYGLRSLDAMLLSSANPTQSDSQSSVAEGNDVAAEAVIQGGETIDEFVNAPPIAKRHLRLRDFNPHAIEKAKNDTKAIVTTNGTTRRLVLEPSTLSGQGVLDDITSSLPYIEVVSRETFEITDVMLDEARILLMTRAQEGQLRGLEVLTL